MNLLLIHPAADFSTSDVARGIRGGLLGEGVRVFDYRLNRRLFAASQLLDQVPGLDDAHDPVTSMIWASEGIPFQAIGHLCTWALFVNGVGLHPGALLALRRVGIRVAGWFTEAPYESDDDRELAQAQWCDVCFVNERTSVDTFQDVLDKAGPGRRAVYLPHAYRPELHKLPEQPLPVEDQCDVLFVGTGFAERQWLIEAIDWTGINLRIGGLWPGIQQPSHLADHYVYPCLPNAETTRLYGGAKIVLNPHRWHPTAESCNPRVYEVAACGAFQIADRRAEIADLFGGSVPQYEPGVPWRLAALIRRYLADDVGRQRLADEARQRVQGQTFGARARTIIETLAAFDRQPARIPALASA